MEKSGLYNRPSIMMSKGNKQVDKNFSMAVSSITIRYIIIRTKKQKRKKKQNKRNYRECRYLFLFLEMVFITNL